MWRKSNSYVMHRKLRRVCWCMLNCIALLSVIAVTFSTSRWLGYTLPIATEEPKRMIGKENTVLCEFLSYKKEGRKSRKRNRTDNCLRNSITVFLCLIHSVDNIF